jgi:putative transposase
MSSSIYNQYTGYHNRRSIRLPGYNYSSIGYYFVTICIHDRTQQNCLAMLWTGNMVLNAYGGIVRACWHDLPNHYANVVLDEFIIMPDHIHGIIRLVP